MKILVLNAGSSSQKCALYEVRESPPIDPPEPLWQGHIDWSAGFHVAKFLARNAAGGKVEERCQVESRAAAVHHTLASLWNGPAAVIAGSSEVEMVGHRVVHGGQEFCSASRIFPAIRASIMRLGTFAPLHNAAALEGMQVIDEIFGDVPQVAVFDTAFHAGLPAAAATYAGPYDWLARGIRRYGFHGISHQYCSQRAAHMMGCEPDALNAITCHLGNGCSLAAVRAGQSIDTTMGFTPLDGLVMGTRSGSVDPGILIHLMREENYTAERLDKMLNSESGLLGLSGLSNDMREILSAMGAGNARAQLAFDVFVHRLRALIGAMIAALGASQSGKLTLDVIVFTAGIGENSPEVRAATCAPFEFVGLRLDAEKNARSMPDCDISAAGSRVTILVIRAQEEWAIARECWELGTGDKNSGARRSTSEEK